MATKTPQPTPEEVKQAAHDWAVQKILSMIEAGQFDDTELDERLCGRIEQHKRITKQMAKDHCLKLTEQDHFRSYASYVLKEGTLGEQDDFIRDLNVPLFVQNRQIFKRVVTLDL